MNEPTNGELMRVMQRVEGKVDTQGVQISRLDVRMAVLEDRDTREPERPRGRLLAGSGLGAAAVMVLEYLRHQFGGGKP